MNKSIIYIIVLLIVASYTGHGQTDTYNGKYGGPFVTLTNNQHGSSLSFGGGGTFYIRQNYYIGIFGQGMSSVIPKKSNLTHFTEYDIKSRFTGFWVGYFQKIESIPKFYISYYTKVGFGQVYLDNAKISTSVYDRAMLFSPHIEPVFSLTYFLKVGVGVFYDFYSGAKLHQYDNSDFNAWGLNLSIRFVSSSN